MFLWCFQQVEKPNMFSDSMSAWPPPRFLDGKWTDFFFASEWIMKSEISVTMSVTEAASVRLPAEWILANACQKQRSEPLANKAIFNSGETDLCPRLYEFTKHRCRERRVRLSLRHAQESKWTRKLQSKLKSNIPDESATASEVQFVPFLVHVTNYLLTTQQISHWH